LVKLADSTRSECLCGWVGECAGDNMAVTGDVEVAIVHVKTPGADNRPVLSNSTVGRLFGYSMPSDLVNRVFIRYPLIVLAPHPKTRALIKRSTRSKTPLLADEGFLSANCIRALLFIMLRYAAGRKRFSRQMVLSLKRVPASI